MADDDKKPPHDAMSDLWFFLGIVAVIVFLWYMSGGAERADLRGIFLNPPEPLGSGEAYGPAFATTTTVEEPQRISPADY